MKLDIKGWQKIRGSDTHSIMRNEEGHQLKIAHNALSEAHRKALMDLPISESKPAKASGEAKAEEQAPKPAAPVKSNAPSNKPDVKKLDADAWQGRDAKMYADGGPVAKPKAAPKDDVPDPDPKKAGEFVKGATSSGAISLGDAWQNIKTGLGYADGGPVSSMQDSPEQIAQDAAQTPVEDQMQNAVQQAPADQSFFGGMQGRADDRRLATEASAAPQQGVPAQQAPAPQGAMPSQPQGQGDPFGTQAYSDAYQKGLGEEKAGFNKEADTAAALGQQQAEAIGKAQEAQAATQLSYQNHYNELDKERQAFQADIANGHIDPNRYIHSKSTGSKIMTAIGLIVGGMGAGLTHTENPVDKYLQQQIANDMEAQKLELGKKENLLSANMRQFGNLRDATDMTRVQIQDALANTMKKAAAQQAGPAAKAALLQKAGILDQQSAGQLSQIAMRKTLLSGANDGRIPPEQVIRAIVPESHQNEAYKQLKDAQSAAALRDNTLSAFDQIAKLQTIGQRVGHPFDSYQQIQKIKNLTLDKLTKDTSGRVTPETVHLVGSTFADLSNGKKTVEQARKILNDVLSSGMHYPLLDTYGIKQYSVKPQGPAAIGPPKFNQR